MAIQNWGEQYRPKTLDEYVWRDPHMRAKVEQWLSEGGLPSLLLSGVAGTGKTSLALLLLRLLDIPSADLLKIKASRERKIEDLQDKIVGFVNCWALNPSGLKYVFLDESDKLSQHAQGMLREEISAYTDTCRFIFACNYPNKIIPALHSRLTHIKFSRLDEGEFITRAADVLDAEKVKYDPEVLMSYYTMTYPDLRKCIGLLQDNTMDGVLNPLRDDDEGVKDYLIQSVDLFKEGHFIEARKLIIAQADPDEYNDIYRFFYENLSLFGKTQDQQEDALLIIRKAIVHDGVVADREINMAAALVELTRIGK